MELKWDQLVPPAPPKPPKSFLADRPGRPDQARRPARRHAGTLAARGPLDVDAAAQSGAAARRPWSQSLDGKRVHIGGYVVPLDFDATRVKEFLLVPFVGACIHVPPPPANQIVYVKTEQGFDVQGSSTPCG